MLVAGIVAYLSVRHPWVGIRITHVDENFQTDLAARLRLRGSDGLAGRCGYVLAGAMAAWGGIWFWYAFDRGAGIPRIAAPGAAVLTTLAGVGLAVLCAMVWFVWTDAAIQHARAAGMTAATMQQLLNEEPLPLVDIRRLGGLFEFGGMMVLGQLASYLAFWANGHR